MGATCRELPKKKTSGNIDSKDISQEAWPGFQNAIQAEVQSMIEHYKAFPPMSIEDTEKTRKKRPERLFPSRHHLHRKPVDTEGGDIGYKPKRGHRTRRNRYKPKRRWTIVGVQGQLEGAPYPILGQHRRLLASVGRHSGPDPTQGYQVRSLAGQAKHEGVLCDAAKRRSASP